MPLVELSALTWPEARDLPRATTVPLLPVGAIEAHGPHLPLATDVIIAEAMAREAGRQLAQAGLTALLLPALRYVSAEFAADFPGTISVRPETVAGLLTDLATSLQRQGFRCLALANAHFDPGHLAALHGAADSFPPAAGFQVIFPDIVRRPWPARLTEEFRSGACHAGRYEGSIVLAEHPDLVRDDVRRALPANPRSLSDAIRAGHRSFAEAGGAEAYFGDPAAATAEEGHATVATLGTILAEAVRTALAPGKEQA